MSASCHSLESSSPSYKFFSQYHQHTDRGGGNANLFTHLFFCTNAVMERTERRRNWDSVHAIKTSPKGKQSHTLAAILRKTWIAFISPLKCKCHLLLERCITISKDPGPRDQHTTEKNRRHARPNIHFYFPINSCPARQEFHISCRDTETNRKLKFIFCVAAISVPVLSSPAVFLNLILKIALLETDSGS